MKAIPQRQAKSRVFFEDASQKIVENLTDWDYSNQIVKTILESVTD